MVPVLASAQLTSEMQGAGQRGASFPRLGSSKAHGTWAMSIQGKKKLSRARAATDPEAGLLWGLPLPLGIKVSSEVVLCPTSEEATALSSFA